MAREIDTGASAKTLLPAIILDELEKIDRNRWCIENTGGHAKLKIDGKLVGVFSCGGARRQSTDVRPALNVRSQIRRYLSTGAAR